MRWVQGEANSCDTARSQALANCFINVERPQDDEIAGKSWRDRRAVFAIGRLPMPGER